MEKQDVAVLGAGGFTGRELLSILAQHPRLRPALVTSNQHAGRSVAEVFPELEGRLHATFQTHDESIPGRLPVFLAVPNETALARVPRLFADGHPVVDLSGAFRLHDQQAFERTYGLTHSAFDLMPEVVYGMPELFRERISGARLVANPGCFPTGAVIPLHLLGEHRDQLLDIVIDAKSGVSGAGGRTEDAGFSYNSVTENFRAYKILRHQHEPEIQEYGAHPGAFSFRLAFTPHLLPVYRGILSTIVLRWRNGAPHGLGELMERRCRAEPFVRFLEQPEDVELRRVVGTNFVDVALRSEGDRTIIVSAIDNLVKGAAGQAVQNLNLMLGFEETAGLAARHPPVAQPGSVS